MATELISLGTAGAPMLVPGRGGISSALIVDGRVFVVDYGRGSPSAFATAGLDFTRLDAVFLTHLHADHIGDLPGMLLYPWGVRTDDHGPLAPVRVYGPSRPSTLPAGDAVFHRETTIYPKQPAPGTADRNLHRDAYAVVAAPGSCLRYLAIARPFPAPDARAQAVMPLPVRENRTSLFPNGTGVLASGDQL